MIQVGNGSLQEAEQEYEIKEFDDLMHEVEQMKEQIRNLIDDVVEKEKSIQRTEYEKLLYQINPQFSAQYVKFRSVDGKNEPSGQYYGICTALKKTAVV